MAVQLKSTEASETWRSVITAFTRVNSLLAEEMDAETDVSLDWYSILILLSQAPDGAMRPSDLAAQTGLSRSGATRLIDRLENDGLVERRSCGTDRRGTFVALTRAGEAKFIAAGRVHLRGIDEHIGSALSPDEMIELRRLLTQLADSVERPEFGLLGCESDED